MFAAGLGFAAAALPLFPAGPTAIILPARIFTGLDQPPGPVVMAAGSVLAGLALLVFVLFEPTVGISRAFGLDDH